MTSMGFAQTTQSDQIKGKMDDSGQFFVEYPGVRLCHILNVYLGQYTYSQNRRVSPEKTFSGS